MSSTTKTDNSRLGSKLALRRHFLDRYHKDSPPRVFDACQGEGVIWQALRADYPMTYWGVDKKRRSGRMSIDSTRILAEPGWRFDVIDVDTYGSPWKHWAGILKNAPGAVTVFLTIGSTMFVGSTDTWVLGVLGMDAKLIERLPMSFRRIVSDMGTEYALASALKRFKVVDCKEAEPASGARYIGVRLVPIPQEAEAGAV